MISIMIQNNTIWYNEARRSKIQHNVLKSSLNEKSTERFKSGEEKMTSKCIKLFYKSREAVIKLFNDYSSILSAKFKVKHKEELTILTPK